jgi:NADPH-dependent 7-cyano-7-deazaguanine reductase QueF
LRTERVPSGLSTLVTLTAALRRPSTPQTGRLTLAYVPDRSVLTPESFRAYAAGCAAAVAAPEALAAQIAADVANEVVPKWQRVTVTLVDNGVAHSAAVEDRQPNWNDSSLLAVANTLPVTTV